MCASRRKIAGPSAVGDDFMPSKTPVPYCSPCARTCTFASAHATSLPLNQIESVGVNPIRGIYIVLRGAGRYVGDVSQVSEYRVEKRRAEAALTLTTGATVHGCFFLAGARATQGGPERVADLLNAETGFFPFEMNGQSAPHTVLYNRAQVVVVALVGETVEASLDAGYNVDT